jgi:hypothetical protein
VSAGIAHTNVPANCMEEEIRESKQGNLLQFWEFFQEMKQETQEHKP